MLLNVEFSHLRSDRSMVDGYTPFKECLIHQKSVLHKMSVPKSLISILVRHLPKQSDFTFWGFFCDHKFKPEYKFLTREEYFTRDMISRHVDNLSLAFSQHLIINVNDMHISNTPRFLPLFSRAAVLRRFPLQKVNVGAYVGAVACLDTRIIMKKNIAKSKTNTSSCF